MASNSDLTSLVSSIIGKSSKGAARNKAEAQRKLKYWESRVRDALIQASKATRQMAALVRKNPPSVYNEMIGEDMAQAEVGYPYVPSPLTQLKYLKKWYDLTGKQIYLDMSRGWNMSMVFEEGYPPSSKWPIAGTTLASLEGAKTMETVVKSLQAAAAADGVKIEIK